MGLVKEVSVRFYVLVFCYIDMKVFYLMRRMCNAQFKNLVTLTRKEWQPTNQEVQLLKVTRLEMEIRLKLLLNYSAL